MWRGLWPWLCWVMKVSEFLETVNQSGITAGHNLRATSLNNDVAAIVGDC